MQEKRKVIKQAHNNFATLLFTFGEKRTLWNRFGFQTQRMLRWETLKKADNLRTARPKNTALFLKDSF
jgi:hypothetical protein